MGVRSQPCLPLCAGNFRYLDKPSNMQTLCPGNHNKPSQLSSNSSPVVDLLMDEVRGHLCCCCCCCPRALAQTNCSQEECSRAASTTFEMLQGPATPLSNKAFPADLGAARGSCASPLLLQAPRGRAEPLQTPVKYLRKLSHVKVQSVPVANETEYGVLQHSC